MPVILWRVFHNFPIIDKLFKDVGVVVVESVFVVVLGHEIDDIS